MGSQTLEILRQGFWASFTGGWFFDPRQEIFCNTFHLYLWMYLLLLPFVLFLTTGPSNISLLLYPIIILLTFIVLKFINVRLHLMFDGEEVINEVNESKDRETEEGKTGCGSAQNQGEEMKKSDDIELDVLNFAQCFKSEGTEPVSNGTDEAVENDISDNGIEKDTRQTVLELAKQAAVEGEDDEFTEAQTKKEEAVVKKKEKRDSVTSKECIRGSSSGFSSISSLSSSGGRAELVVVDVHKITQVHNDKGTIVEQLQGKSEDQEDAKLEGAVGFSKESSLENCEGATNGPMQDSKELADTTPQDTMVPEDINGSSQFPLNLWRLVDSNSDLNGSHGSELNSINDKAVASEKPRFTSDAKSDNTLRVSNKEIDGIEGDSQDKAVSMSALEANSNGEGEAGQRSKTSQAVWFSLPEMEKTNEDNVFGPGDEEGLRRELAKKVMASSEGDNGDDSHWSTSLKHLNDGSTEEGGSDKEKDETKSEPEADTRQGFVVELLDSYEGRRLNRRGATRQSFRDYIRERSDRSLRLRRRRLVLESAGSSLLGQDDDSGDQSQNASRHVALTHDDTTAGAVHCFKDEFGIWHTYVFGDEGGEVEASATQSTDHSIGSTLNRDMRSSSRRGAESGSTQASLTDRDLFESVYQEVRLSHLLSGGVEPRPWAQFASPGSMKVSASELPPRRYYKLHVYSSFFVKIWFDRLALLALLDRVSVGEMRNLNKTLLETVIAILFGGLTAWLGYMLLSRDYVYDLWIFILCFVIAKCQFSLLKSVQPDSASPVHGHNNVIVFSRAAYFCCVAAMILLLDEASKSNPTAPKLYGINIYSKATLEFTRDALIAMTSLQGSFYSIFKSVASVGFLYGFCYAAMKTESKAQHILFSIYCGLLTAVSCHLSRCTSDPLVLWEIFKSKVLRMDLRNEEGDPLPEKLRKTVLKRLGNDIIVSTGIIIIVFAVHVSTMFTRLQPNISYILFGEVAVLGIVNHYLIPQLRKQLPWLIGSSPVLKSSEYDIYEAFNVAHIMWFERAYVWLCVVERNVLYPLTFINCLTRDAHLITGKFGPVIGSLIITITGMKLLRSSFTATARQHIVLIWTVLFFEYDYRGNSETFPIDYFIMSIFVDKAIDLLLKFRFILTYTAPWQITWGSAFHAFAQPFSLPPPLNPFLGSAIFITSYVRPTKFWEKNYNTKRADHSNTRLSSHLDNNPCSDDNNLNSIFYEHLSRSLQHSLCGDLMLGRWGNVSSGDFFFVASDYLNALVHIVELGNGFVTFQLRGLEFRGTYCQQRELEAITEWADNDGGCCYGSSSSCGFSRLLSCKAAFNQRWLAWEVIQSKYILEGYSVSDNTATSMFQVFDLRKIFITYYVKAIIFYALKSPKLKNWISDERLMSSLAETRKQSFVDRDAVFRAMTDEDYDVRPNGVSRTSFCSVYLDWIKYCNNQLEESIEEHNEDSNLVTLCFALSLLGRRMFFTASHQPATTLKSFLHGLHALFKGDFRVSSSKDEWVFADPDMELLRKVISPAVKMSVKLHQDHFVCPDEYDDNVVLYDAISSHDEKFVISHEGDPVWRQAVLNNKPTLLALRYVIDEGNDDYRIITLNKRFLTFRIVKVNRECVRGLWAGQLQELIFLRNRNPERGSIQNAKQALRNMINSSCDQPIGYPIYVSPLITSYADTNKQLTQVIGGPVNLNVVSRFASWVYERLAHRYGGACNPSSNPEPDDLEPPLSVAIPTFRLDETKVVAAPQLPFSRASSHRTSYTAVPNPPRRSSSLASGVVLPPTRQASYDCQKVCIANANLIIDPVSSTFEELQWPSNELKELVIQEFAERNADWKPIEGTEFEVVHAFNQPRADVKQRGHQDETILLLISTDKYVLIPESGVNFGVNYVSDVWI
eukprot:gene2882-1119_t